ncbi:MAG TPA: nicotinate (nicotinamide) nucleotide adenylyltransferase [Candidatus Dormibacteraeota bacterium]
MTAEVRRVAVLGGTFDPVHAGHLAIVVAVREAIGADEAWLLPARTPALRSEPVAPAPLRLAMLEAAVRGVPGVRVVDLELRRPGISYTIDTLAGLASADAGTQPWWILGADAVRHIGEWHRSAELREAVHLAVVQRQGEPRFNDSEVRALGLHPGRTVVLDIWPPAVSASEVRARVAAGEAVAGLVPAAVAAIIAASGLYRSTPAVR